MFWIGLCLAISAMLVGVRALLLQFSAGLSATGLSDRFSWGVYIQGFLALGSLAGGMLFLAGASGLFLGEALLAPMAGATALGCLAGAGVMIAADLGKPFRSFLLVFGKNTGSAMTWDFYTFALCGLLAFTAVIHGMVGALPGLLWSALALITSSAFLLMHVLLLLPRQKSPANNPFLALEMFLRALWGGAALLTLISFGVGLELGLSTVLLVLSLTLAPVHGVGLFAKQRPESAHAFSWVNRALMADMAIAAALLAGACSQTPFLSGLAAAAALLMLAWEKTRLVHAFQTQSVLPAPYSQWQPAAPYKPSLLELQVCLGSLGLAMLATMLALRLVF